jgi:hypothetical protein
LSIAEHSNQSSLGFELVIKPEEFDAVWELMAEKKVRE